MGNEALLRVRSNVTGPFLEGFSVSSHLLVVVASLGSRHQMVAFSWAPVGDSPPGWVIREMEGLQQEPAHCIATEVEDPLCLPPCQTSTPFWDPRDPHPAPRAVLQSGLSTSEHPPKCLF